MATFVSDETVNEMLRLLTISDLELSDAASKLKKSKSAAYSALMILKRRGQAIQVIKRRFSSFNGSHKPVTIWRAIDTK